MTLVLRSVWCSLQKVFKSRTKDVIIALVPAPIIALVSAPIIALVPS